MIVAGVVDLGTEEDLKGTVENHGERIQKLEIDNEVMKERWSNISTQLTRIENNSLASNNALLASNNSMLQTMGKLVEGNAKISSDNVEVVKIKNTNKTQVILKVLGIVSIIVLGILVGLGIDVSGFVK